MTKATCIEVVVIALSIFFVLYCKGKLQFFVAPVMLCFIMVFAFDGGWVSRFMSLPIFRYLAKISYSVYMVHAFIAIGFAIVGLRLFPDYLIAGNITYGAWGDLYNVPYLLCVIGVSHLTWKYVEVPGGKLLRGLKLSSFKAKLAA